MQQQAINLDIPSQMQSPVDVQPWNPLTMSDPQDAQMFSMDGFPLSSPSPPAPFTPGSFGSSQEASPPSMGGGRLELSSGNISQLPETSQRASPFNQFQIQDFFMEQQPLQPQPQPHSSTAPPAASSKSPSTAATVASRPIPARSSGSSINKVRGAGSRIEKRKATNTSSSAEKIQASVSSSAASEDKFFIVTPTTINSHTGHGSRIFECLEAMSATQKGRKGPLAEEIKEGALQVRRLGACFCCHARKVRCDAQRPCKNCMKLRLAVPFAVCWRFDDFLADLFPSKIRVHLSKDKMMAFYQENIFSFDVANVPAEPITIHLSSGMAFKNTLEIRGVRFFNPATIDIVRHERLLVEGNNAFRKVFLAVPLALEMSDTSLISASQQQEKVRKALRSYVENIIAEEPYVNQIGASINHTDLPKKILHMVWNYYMETEVCVQSLSPYLHGKLTRHKSLIVKQALVIYTMHYMMAQHLSIAKESILKFKSTKLMPQEDDFLTSRMLGRQVKTILDELLQEEVDKLFKMFSRELKPKSRASWAPCLAAFLVLCLFMEAVGLVIDRFVNAHNEKELQSDRSPKNSGYLRSEAVNLSRAIENMPFRQFAFQFHNVYQTHQTPPGAVNVTTSSSSAGSPSSSMSSAASVAASAAKISFNPLLDDTLLLSNDLDKPAVELVTRLRELLTGDSLIRLQELSWTPILDAIDPYPYPRDVAVDYNGRLCSKFLLSFYDKDKIFTQPSSF